MNQRWSGQVTTSVQEEYLTSNSRRIQIFFKNKPHSSRKSTVLYSPSILIFTFEKWRILVPVPPYSLFWHGWYDLLKEALLNFSIFPVRLQMVIRVAISQFWKGGQRFRKGVQKGDMCFLNGGLVLPEKMTITTGKISNINKTIMSKR